MVPSIAVMPREGSLALAFLGRVRKLHDSALRLSAGRKSFALKRISEAALVICLVSLIVMHFLDAAGFTRSIHLGFDARAGKRCQTERLVDLHCYSFERRVSRLTPGANLVEIESKEANKKYTHDCDCDHIFAPTELNLVNASETEGASSRRSF
jgi:hypothetical protein